MVGVAQGIRFKMSELSIIQRVRLKESGCNSIVFQSSHPIVLLLYCPIVFVSCCPIVVLFYYRFRRGRHMISFESLKCSL